MPVFSDNSDDLQGLDWKLLKNGSVHLYYRSAVLIEDAEWLENHGYQLDNFDCSTWETEKAMHEDFASRLYFPNYYGKNLDALNDCLRYVDVSDSGRVLIFHRYDIFTAKNPQMAWDVLDIIDSKAWLHLLFGRRLFALVQSDDPSIKFPLFSSRGAVWNPSEWLYKSRGL